MEVARNRDSNVTTADDDRESAALTRRNGVRRVLAGHLNSGPAMLRPLVAVASLVVALFAPRIADAGCPAATNEGCNLPAMPVVQFAAPAASCVQVTYEENDCVCSTILTLHNNCNEPLEAVDFAWCRFLYQDSVCPTTIEPGGIGYLELAGADTLGEHTVTLQTRLGTTDVPMQITFEMVNVRYGTGCSAAGHPSAAFVPLLVLMLGATRRRRTVR